MMDIVTRLREIVRERRQRGAGATIIIDENITNWIEEAANEIDDLRQQIPAPPPQ